MTNRNIEYSAMSYKLRISRLKILQWIKSTVNVDVQHYEFRWAWLHDAYRVCSRTEE